MKLGSAAASAALSSWEDSRNEPPDDDVIASYYEAHISIFRGRKSIKHYTETVDGSNDVPASRMVRDEWLKTPNGIAWKASGESTLPVKESSYYTELKGGWQFERVQCGGIKMTVRYEPVEDSEEEDGEPCDGWKEAHGY